MKRSRFARSVSALLVNSGRHCSAWVQLKVNKYAKVYALDFLKFKKYLNLYRKKGGLYLIITNVQIMSSTLLRFNNKIIKYIKIC